MLNIAYNALCCGRALDGIERAEVTRCPWTASGQLPCNQFPRAAASGQYKSQEKTMPLSQQVSVNRRDEQLFLVDSNLFDHM